MTKFTDLSLPEPIQRAAKALDYESPTSIQELAIPWLLDNDQDLIALAQTGTGKTAAFGFPTLSRTDIEKRMVQTLVLCPTRELCLQITKDIESFSKYMPGIKSVAVYGGAPIYKQKDALKSGAQIVVGTPGRVYDLINQKVLKVEGIDRLILDEADEMLNMGFKEELFNIMSHTPEDKQILLFSATMNRDVEKLANTFMKDPFRISVGNENQGADNIEHYYYKVHARDKYLALKRIADMSPRIYGIIFCRTRTETQEIANKLQHDGYNADALHGDLSQGQRELVMSRFRSKYVQLLVATDVAARGLDVDDLTHIINYQVPTDPEIYIHRSGRTGRAGKSGVSLTIIHHKEIGALKNMERRLGREIEFSRVPGGREICEKQLFNFIDTVERIEVDSDQIESFLPIVYKKLGWMSREELIQRFVSIEFNRFLNYYKDTADLDGGAVNQKQESDMDIMLKTFRIGIGYKQELNKRDLMRYVNSLKIARSIEIGRINIFEHHSTIELDARFENQILKAFAQNKLNGIDTDATALDILSPAKSSGGTGGGSYSSSKPRRDYNSDGGDKREYKPRKSYGDQGSEKREYTPRKTYGADSGDKKEYKPRKTYGADSGEKKEYRTSKTYSADGVEKREYKPRKTFGAEGGEKREYKPRASFNADSGEKKEYKPRKTFGAEGGEKREYKPRKSSEHSASDFKPRKKATASDSAPKKLKRKKTE